MKNVEKITTDNSNLLFIGSTDDEEFYQKLDEKGGWSFMGLRPETEEKLREYARETDFEDMAGVKLDSWVMNYIDLDKFADDMEEEWEKHHDVQAIRENEKGETFYLGFSSGTDCKRYFVTNNITSYEDYVNHFDVIGLTKKEFDKYVKEYCI